MPIRLLPEKLVVTVIFVLNVILLAGQGYAQVAGAMLTGTVTDSTRAAIPKAKVTITDVATGVVRTVETENAGTYIAPNLLPGTYDVSVTAPGFSTEVQSGITLTVGAKQILDIAMTIGQLSQTVNV